MYNLKWEKKHNPTYKVNNNRNSKCPMETEGSELFNVFFSPPKQCGMCVKRGLKSSFVAKKKRPAT
jgi:hypothetical protein